MEPLTIGWREWLALPDLDLPHVKAKIDTGARTSALHAFCLEPYSVDGVSKVRFGIHPYQKRTDVEQFCSADIIDERWVTDSGGHRERRFVIASRIQIGDRQWPIELTLTNRDNMCFRMLLGRTAMQGHMLIDPNASFLMGKPPRTAFPKRPHRK